MLWQEQTILGIRWKSSPVINIVLAVIFRSRLISSQLYLTEQKSADTSVLKLRRKSKNLALQAGVGD